MKISSMLLAILMSAGLAFGQTTQTPTPMTPPAGHQRMAQHQQMMAQHQQMMEQHLQQAQAKVEQLKADIAKVSDAATKQALQDDADMWQMMIDHMKNMGGMMHHGMKGPHGVGMKGGMHGMGCAGMGGTHPAKPSSGETPAQNPK